MSYVNRAEEMETEVLHAQRSEETKEGGGKVDENVSSNKVFKIQGGPGKICSFQNNCQYSAGRRNWSRYH